MFGLTPWALVDDNERTPLVTSTLSLFVIAFLCGALVAAALAVVRERRKVHQLGEEVADLRDETALLERRDEATGLYNSRHFVEALTREIERSRTYGRPLALALASVETRPRHDDGRRANPARAGRRDRRQRAGDRPGLPGRLDRVRRDHARDRHQGRLGGR